MIEVQGFRELVRCSLEKKVGGVFVPVRKALVASQLSSGDFMVNSHRLAVDSSEGGEFPRHGDISWSL